MLLALMGLTLTACAPDLVGTSDGDPDTPAPNGDSDTFEVWADALTDSALLTMEFAERESDVGLLGWHIVDEESFEGEVLFQADLSDLQDILDDRGYTVVVSNVQCVRWNVNYDSGRDLCEGNGASADTIAESGANWLGEELDVWLWSDPGGEGCSLVTCRN
ncbi:MAG: hypothetical protein HQ488_01605 [Parcubacteria group bacterium]|nr:hypothetical protein [Parcubacteria group bacterium]